MKIIIAGSRTITEFGYIENTVNQIIQDYDYNDIEIVSGNAKGVDKLGEEFATKYKYKLKLFPADWSKGKSAGYKRNVEMAKYADMLIAFWDGESKGTKHMIDTATKHDLQVDVFILRELP